MNKNTQDLLFEKYRQYLEQSGQRKTLKEFAAEIGIGQAYLNQLMNGKRKPGEKTAELLAEYFNDPRFYDAIGMVRPDPRLNYITRHWGEIPDQIQKKITSEIANFTTEKIPE